MADAVQGRVHSFESCGMVDGPGLRFIVFVQGCPLRCLYCHNPDSWRFTGGKEMGSREVVREAIKYKAWMETSGGGITISGGEALSQPDFTHDIIVRAKKKGIHTALDTSGFAPLSRSKECLDESDLVLLDIKTTNKELHKKLCSVDLDIPMKTLEYLKEIGKPLWIRHVVVPGITDKTEDLNNLLELLKGIPSLKRFEFLPFHKLGEEKWEEEGLEYSLYDTPACDPDFIKGLQDQFRDAGIPVPE